MHATLNLIGPGRLGRTLARLWHGTNSLTIQDVVARDAAHMHEAIAFVGAGNAASLPTLHPAQFTLLAVPDDAIASTALALLDSGCIEPGNVVFHCSGALASDLLAPLREQGARVASVHPLKSFADPALAIQSFAGTYCACEGDEDALALLAPLFDGIGAHRFAIDAAKKTLYHTGAVLACNDLVALMEAALRCMDAAGVDRALAWPALRPLITGTLNNLDRLTTQAALTGPVARGDVNTVAKQMAATKALDGDVAEAYRTLGVLALQLAQLDGGRRAAVLASLGGAA